VNGDYHSLLTTFTSWPGDSGVTKKYLTSCEELNTLLGRGDVVIVDTREPDEYNKAHIPGAVNIDDIFNYLALKATGGYPALVRTFTEIFSEAGITRDKRVVLYEDAMSNGYGKSCRGLFICNYLGHEQASVLHGGFRSWVASGYPVTTEVVLRREAIFKAEVNHSIIVTTEEMYAALDNPSIVKLDVRDFSEWIGETSSPYGVDFCPRKGRLPGAIWIEWYRFMQIRSKIPWFKEKDEILEICQEVGITPDKTVYLYCFKGARASNTYTALKLAGFQDVRNYFSSWNEWSRDLSLPIDSGYPEF
jgi:thiosulfate/3-mercaptopyruvate sulfurtransferase